MTSRSASRWPWIMLFSRISLFIVIQTMFALGFWMAGAPEAWESSTAWWPFVVTITNFITIISMVRLFKQEGKRFWDIFRIQREHIKSDMLALAGMMVLLGPVSYLPNIWFGGLLFGDPQRTLDLLIRPLPLWAVYGSIVLLPVTQALAELATYFAYSMPRLEAQGRPRWLAVSLASLVLALQHIAMPLRFNLPYIIWRGLMFLPFAFLAGVLLRWRPRLLPYMAIVHGIMDLLFALMLLNTAY